MPDGALEPVAWTDDEGRAWVSLAPRGAPVDEAWRYPLIGPPAVAEALERGGWPRHLANAVQAEFTSSGVLTERDLRRKGTTAFVDGVVRRAVRGSVQTVVEAFVVSSRREAGD